MSKSDLAKSPNCFQQGGLKRHGMKIISAFCPTNGAARIICNSFFPTTLLYLTMRTYVTSFSRVLPDWDL